MHQDDDQQQPRAGMRPNYSCNSLQAAEQLGALMQHTPAASMGGDYGQRSQRDLYGGALGGMYSGGGGGGSGCNLGDHSDSIGQHQGFGGGLGHFGCGQQDPYNSAALDRCASQVDTYINQPNLVNFMRSAGGDSSAYGCGVRQAGCGGYSETAPMIPSGLNNFGNGFGGGGHDHHGADMGHGGLGGNALSMLQNAGMIMGGQGGMGGGGYHMGGGGGGMGPSGGGMPGGGDEGSAQKRRFVWTADLHSRFEAAVNALGLDNAKPKSILKLMNVDGLTKANIKSHLQKYRCLMQKKAQQARANGQPAPTGSGGGGGGGNGMGTSGPDVRQWPRGRERRLARFFLRQQRLSFTRGLDGLSSMGGGGGASNNSSVASTINAEGSTRVGFGGLGGVPGGAGLPETLISQGESSLQRNLEVQEMTLKVQMELQEELSRQLMLQKKLQSEMEGLMAAHARRARRAQARTQRCRRSSR